MGVYGNSGAPRTCRMCHCKTGAADSTQRPRPSQIIIVALVRCVQAEELQYFEALMLLSEQLGLSSCAREFATAGLHALDRAFSDSSNHSQSDINMAATAEDAAEGSTDAQLEGGRSERRAKREGRLWSNLFAYSLQDGNYEVWAAADIDSRLSAHM